MQIRKVFAKVGLMALLGLSSQTQAQSWNAYNDFYLSPTAAGWGGNTSALNTAWGYYMGNVNGYRNFPNNVGTYLNAGQLYNLSNTNPAGASDGTRYSNSLWDATGGAGFARYLDNVAWSGPTTPPWQHVSLGRYDNAWFDGAPGFGKGPNGSHLSNFIWMQSAYLGNNAGGLDGPAEGIAAVLTWTAPSSGVYEFAGQFLAGNQPSNSAAVAVMTSSGALLSRTVLNNNSVETFSFAATYYAAGDTVQFQVGNNFSIGNAVGLQVTATAIPEPSSGMLLAAGLGALGLIRRRR